MPKNEYIQLLLVYWEHQMMRLVGRDRGSNNSTTTSTTATSTKRRRRQRRTAKRGTTRTTRTQEDFLSTPSSSSSTTTSNSSSSPRGLLVPTTSTTHHHHRRQEHQILERKLFHLSRRHLPFELRYNRSKNIDLEQHSTSEMRLFFKIKKYKTRKKLF